MKVQSTFSCPSDGGSQLFEHFGPPHVSEGEKFRVNEAGRDKYFRVGEIKHTYWEDPRETVHEIRVLCEEISYRQHQKVKFLGGWF